MKIDNSNILHINEKLTKRLLELKSSYCKLSIKDKSKLRILNKYNIPNKENKPINKRLFDEDQIRYENTRNWQSEDRTNYIIQENPLITENGLTAIKSNYYEVTFFMKKLNHIYEILRIPLTIITIISISAGIRLNCSNTKLKKELEYKQEQVDSLKVIIKELNSDLSNKQNTGKK